MVAKVSVQMLLVAISAASFVSSFSLSPLHQSTISASPRLKSNHHQYRKRASRFWKPTDNLSSSRGDKKSTTALEVATDLSGGAFVPPEVATTVTFLGAVNAFYKTYPIISSVGTCSVKGCLADLIAQRSNRVADDGTVLERAPPFSFRRNFAYIIYSGLVIGLLCELNYHHLYPRLFGKLSSETSVLVATVAFDNFVTAPLVWLPPIYFLKAILYGKPLLSGGKSYVSDVRKEGLWKKYWKVWIPAQIFNFWKVPAHLRVAFMAGTSFFWMIILSCLSSNNHKKAKG